MKKMMNHNRIFSRLLCLLLVSIFVLGLASCGRKEAPQITSIAELKGKTITVLKGSDPAVAAHSNDVLRDCTTIYAMNAFDSLSALLSGKADAFVTDRVPAEILKARYENLIILDEVLTNSEYGFVFAKENQLRAEFDSALTTMMADGTYDSIVSKWMDGQGIKPAMAQDWVGEKGTLKCVVEGNFEPICCFDSNGEITGLDVDLILECCKRLGYNIKFLFTSFDELIPSVVAGFADFAASGISITNTRMERVDFSIPYYDASTVILVRNESISGGLNKVKFSFMGSINRTFIQDARWKLLLSGFETTMLLVLVSVFCGLILGFILYIIYYSEKKLAVVVLHFIDNLFEFLPCSAWFLIVYYLIFAGSATKGVVAGSFALSVLFAIEVFRVFCDSMATIDPGEIVAARSMGYSRYAAFFKLFLPQIQNDFLERLSLMIAGHIRATAVIGVIFVNDFQAMSDIIRAQSLEPFFPVVLNACFYVILGKIASLIVDTIRRYTDNRLKSEDEIINSIMRGARND